MADRGFVDCGDCKVVWRNEEYSGAVPRFFTGMSPIIVDGMAAVGPRQVV